MKTKSALALHIISLLLFGMNGVIASFISLDSYEIVFFRTLIGSVSLALIFVLTGRKWTFYKHGRQCIFLAISGASMGCSWMFLYEAFKQVGVSVGTLLYYCGPMIVIALSPLLFGEKLNAIKITGFAAVFLGVFLVNGTFGGAEFNIFGFFCGMASALTYAVMVIFNKKAKDITGLENSSLQLLVAFAVVSAFLVIKQGFSLRVESGDWLPILIIGLLNTGLGCFFFFSTISKLKVQTVAVCGYIEPLSAVIFSVIFLSEKMNLLQIIGGVLIIGGALFAELVGRKKPNV